MGVGFPHRNNPPSGLFNKIDWPPDFKAKEIRRLVRQPTSNPPGNSGRAYVVAEEECV